MTWPVDFPVTQPFGANPTKDIRPGSPDYWIILKFGNYQPDGHTGFDCACPVGTPVRAAADGVVLHIGWMSGTYADNPWWVAPDFAGYCAVIDHGNFIGIYGHCKDGSAKVAKGARVREGQVFIQSGNTGGSTGAHLHFEVLPDGYVLNSRFYGRVDPAPYLGSASIGPAGEVTTPTQPQEDELSAAEVKQIKDHINDVFLGTYAWDGRLDNPGLGKVIIENQKRITASLDINRRLLALVEALPTNVWWNVTVEREDADGNKYKVPALQELANIGTHQGKDSSVLLEIAGRPAEQVAVEMDKVFTELANRINPDEDAEGDN